MKECSSKKVLIVKMSCCLLPCCFVRALFALRPLCYPALSVTGARLVWAMVGSFSLTIGETSPSLNKREVVRRSQSFNSGANYKEHFPCLIYYLFVYLIYYLLLELN